MKDRNRTGTSRHGVDGERKFAEAIAHHQAGRWEEARKLYEAVLKRDAKHLSALNNLGLIFQTCGDLDAAIERYQLALRLKPDFLDALFNLANALRAQGKLSEAIPRYHQILRLKPDHFGALTNLGNSLRDQDQTDAAVACYERALRIKPDAPETLNNLVLALRDQGKLAEAMALCEQTLRSRPNSPEMLNHLGGILQTQGRFDEAIERYEQALRFQPGHCEVLNNLGNLFQQQNRSEDAIRRYQQALRFKPDAVDVLNNLGNALKDQDRLTEAIESYQQALRLKPNYPEVLNNLGNVLQDQGKLSEAIAYFKQALHLKPNYLAAYSNLLLCQNYWPGIDEDALFRDHRAFEALCQGPVAQTWHNDRDQTRVLRVGYVSADFRQHPVGWFLEAVWRAHDSGQVAIYAYSDVITEDHLTQRLRQPVTAWRSIVGLSDAEVAAQVQADGIDILIDLAGHTALNRLPLFARRPAPVQVSWLGYPHTTGLSAITAVLMDAVTVPPGGERWFIEQVVRLPESRFCYCPPPNAPEVALPPCLTSGRVTFGSFNNLSKVTPEVLALWARVLAAVPESRLLLKWKTLAAPQEQQRIRTAFAQAGGDPARLDLRGRSLHLASMAEYGLVDIALDPFPFTGATTTCEAMFMGVPVVTWPGARPVSRQTLGILTPLGLETELAAESAEGYVAIAAALARAPDRLVDLRRSLRNRLLTSSLCDGPRFTRALEAAYRSLWEAWCENPI